MSELLFAGLAVGTTGISDKEDLKLVVAFAMVLHKLPATFGLVTFLLASKWPTARVRRALLIFAASAPVMALATYWLLVSPCPSPLTKACFTPDCTGISMILLPDLHPALTYHHSQSLLCFGFL